MERFVEGGVYNLVLLNLAPTGPLYGADPDEPRFFSEEWWHILDQVCAHALKLGISLWVYDQIGFSGANIQGEIVREQPEYAGQWLESVCVEGEGTLEAMCPAHGVPIAAGVVPVDDDGRAPGRSSRRPSSTVWPGGKAWDAIDCGWPTGWKRALTILAPTRAAACSTSFMERTKRGWASTSGK